MINELTRTAKEYQERKLQVENKGKKSSIKHREAKHQGDKNKDKKQRKKKVRWKRRPEL